MDKSETNGRLTFENVGHLFLEIFKLEGGEES